MGCGCTRTSFADSGPKGSAVSHPVDSTKTRADSRVSPSAANLPPPEEHQYTRRKSNYNIIVKKDEILVRFNRKGEVMDYYSRDSLRPGRLSDMLKAYSDPHDSAEGETYPAPSTANSPAASPPATRLALEYVYGYQCYAAKQNLYFLNADEVIYPCGSLVVVLNKTSNTQRFVGGGALPTARGHSDDIISLSISAKKDMLATGEVGFNPLICVWKVSSLDAPFIELEQGLGSRGVGILSFSASNKYLAAVDISADQYIRVFELKSKQLLFSEKGGSSGHIYSLAFNPKGDGFCSVGVSHLFFWGKHSNAWVREKGNFGTVAAECSMSTLQWLSPSTCVTGGHNGKLHLWDNSHLTKVQQVLTGSQEIYALAVSSDFIVTGGQDSKLHVLDLTLKKLKVLDLTDWMRAVDLMGTSIVCSTRDGVITEISGSGQKVLIETHSEGEVWSLTQDPRRPNIIISTGDDNKIKVWDIDRKKCISTCTIETMPVQNTAHRSSLLPSSQQSRAVAVCGEQVAVGHNDGHVSIRRTLELDAILFALTPSRTWIRFLQYSPTGDKLAVGANDGLIVVYDATNNYVELTTFEGYTSPVTSLDWSVDGMKLKTCSQDGELRFFDVANQEYIDDGKTVLRDEPWMTWTSHKGWPVQGLGELPSEEPFITCVSRAHRKGVTAVGNCWGLVDLYTFPSGAEAKANSWKAHSLEVANVLWTLDDSTLVTAGGHDLSLMQWKVLE